MQFTFFHFVVKRAPTKQLQFNFKMYSNVSKRIQNDFETYSNRFQSVFKAILKHTLIHSRQFQIVSGRRFDTFKKNDFNTFKNDSTRFKNDATTSNNDSIRFEHVHSY